VVKQPKVGPLADAPNFSLAAVALDASALSELVNTNWRRVLAFGADVRLRS
jgi:hypothetical protein